MEDKAQMMLTNSTGMQSLESEKSMMLNNVCDGIFKWTENKLHTLNTVYSFATQIVSRTVGDQLFICCLMKIRVR